MSTTPTNMDISKMVFMHKAKSRMLSSIKKDAPVEDYIQGFIDMFDPNKTGVINLADIESKVKTYCNQIKPTQFHSAQAIPTLFTFFAFLWPFPSFFSTF